jgi:hypothetical protein
MRYPIVYHIFASSGEGMQELVRNRACTVGNGGIHRVAGVCRTVRRPGETA